jgi:hypothetical protein
MKYLNRFIRYLFPKFQPIDKYKKEISALSKIKMNQQKIILSLEDNGPEPDCVDVAFDGGFIENDPVNKGFLHTEYIQYNV